MAHFRNLRICITSYPLQQPFDLSSEGGHDKERVGVSFDTADGLFGDG